MIQANQGQSKCFKAEQSPDKVILNIKKDIRSQIRFPTTSQVKLRSHLLNQYFNVITTIKYLS